MRVELSVYQLKVPGSTSRYIGKIIHPFILSSSFHPFFIPSSEFHLDTFKLSVSIGIVQLFMQQADDSTTFCCINMY